MNVLTMGWCSNLEAEREMRKDFRHGNSQRSVVRTPCFHCRRLGLIPGGGDLDPASHKGVIMESLSLALPLLCQLGLQFPLYTWDEKAPWEELTRAEFQTKESTLHKQLPAAGCVHESQGVCVYVCMCVDLHTLHLYASHSGRRRKERCCFYTSVNIIPS